MAGIQMMRLLALVLAACAAASDPHQHLCNADNTCDDGLVCCRVAGHHEQKLCVTASSSSAGSSSSSSSSRPSRCPPHWEEVEAIATHSWKSSTAPAAGIDGSRRWGVISIFYPDTNNGLFGASAVRDARLLMLKLGVPLSNIIVIGGTATAKQLAEVSKKWPHSPAQPPLETVLEGGGLSVPPANIYTDLSVARWVDVVLGNTAALPQGKTAVPADASHVFLFVGAHGSGPSGTFLDRFTDWVFEPRGTGRLRHRGGGAVWFDLSGDSSTKVAKSSLYKKDKTFPKAHDGMAVTGPMMVWLRQKITERSKASPAQVVAMVHSCYSASLFNQEVRRLGDPKNAPEPGSRKERLFEAEPLPASLFFTSAHETTPGAGHGFLDAILKAISNTGPSSTWRNVLESMRRASRDGAQFNLGDSAKAEVAARAKTEDETNPEYRRISSQMKDQLMEERRERKAQGKSPLSGELLFRTLRVRAYGDESLLDTPLGVSMVPVFYEAFPPAGPFDLPDSRPETLANFRALLACANTRRTPHAPIAWLNAAQYESFAALVHAAQQLVNGQAGLVKQPPAVTWSKWTVFGEGTSLYMFDEAREPQVFVSAAMHKDAAGMAAVVLDRTNMPLRASLCLAQETPLESP